MSDDDGIPYREDIRRAFPDDEALQANVLQVHSSIQDTSLVIASVSRAYDLIRNTNFVEWTQMMAEELGNASRHLALLDRQIRTTSAALAARAEAEQRATEARASARDEIIPGTPKPRQGEFSAIASIFSGGAR